MPLLRSLELRQLVEGALDLNQPKEPEVLFLGDHKTATSHLDFCFFSHDMAPEPIDNALRDSPGQGNKGL